MNDDLRAEIQALRAKIAARVGVDLAKEDFELALADRILAAHEILAHLAESRPCWRMQRFLGRCE